jgi:hypothetical protein
MSNLLCPERTPWCPIMLDPEVQEIMDYLHNGYPRLGWEGDERLGLYRGRRRPVGTGRLCEDGVMRTICRSRPGRSSDLDLIVMRLVEHDARRGHDPAEDSSSTTSDLQARRDRRPPRPSWSRWTR